jgi:hypothetical protein
VLAPTSFSVLDNTLISKMSAVGTHTSVSVGGGLFG